jgi:prepilin signal peptidase PulO-like enzyme (type II secretory pathway)
MLIHAGFLILCSVVGGAMVNLAADILPTKQSLRQSWRWPLAQLPGNLLGRLGLDDGTVCPPHRLRHLLVYCASLCLSWFAYLHYDGSWQAVVLAVQAWFFLAVAVIDLEHRLVLNRMLVAGLPLILVSNTLLGLPTLPSALLGGAAGFSFFLLLALLAPGAMGMGDVKLAGFIGLTTGLSGVMSALLIGITAGGIGGLAVLVGNRFRRGKTMAYAPFLVLGVWFVLYDFVLADLIRFLQLYMERL